MATLLGIRELIEFTCRSGNLGMSSNSQNTALMGANIHRDLQSKRPENYDAEVTLEIPATMNGQDFRIHGRADGIIMAGNDTLIEEIKTSDRKFEDLPDSTLKLYWGQVTMYAHIVMTDEDLDQLTMRLTYFQTSNEHITETDWVITRGEAALFYKQVTEKYASWLKFRSDIVAKRNPTIKPLPFPFPAYRTGQHELAAAVYKTIVNQKRLFAEAPTGTGKTISTLFPTVKAMGEGYVNRVFYLTAKQSTRRVAEEGIGLMVKDGLKIKSITLTAKEKMAFPEEKDLKPEENPYMIGYYDRVDDGIIDLMTSEDQLTKEIIQEYAKKHTLDPFEFSLDVSLYCDVIICDYNYLFDPRVYLQRFFSEPDKENFFLIDEAHNLVSRSRDMYSAEIQQDDLDKLIDMVKGTDQDALLNRLRALHRAFMKYAKPLRDEGATDLTNFDPIDGIINALGKATDFIREWLPDHEKYPAYDDVLDCYFLWLTYLKINDFYDDTYRTRVTLDGPNVIYKQLCLDPSAFLSKTLDLGGGAVLFSATLSPLDYYERVLGGNDDSLCYQLPSPFPPEHQGLYITTYIQTTYQQRDQNLAKILVSIKQMVDAHKGNYLIFLPSYSYLTTIYQAFKIAYPDIQTTVQEPQMAEADRTAFLTQFDAQTDHPFVGFALLGGIFSEGIDLKADRLIGVGIIGVALPGISQENNLLRDYFDEQNHHGFEFAYQLPGLNNVFQAAGRLIRGMDDRGVVLLIDQRFAAPRYTSLFPPHWQHYQRLNSPQQLSAALDDFWLKVNDKKAPA